METRTGRFFEDFRLGERLVHPTPRTLTEGDASLYIALTGARQIVHSALPVAHALGHRDRPLDDLLVFHVAFGKTVPDVSLNAIANLGYADMRFLAPVYAGDTLRAESTVIGLRETSNRKSGVVYVRSDAYNQDGRKVLTWARWVLVHKRDFAAPAPEAHVPDLPREVPPDQLAVPAFLRAESFETDATGSTDLWDDYAPGERIDHPGGMTVDESDHTLATKLYQNTARVHFDGHAMAGTAHGRRLMYGGHVHLGMPRPVLRRSGERARHRRGERGQPRQPDLRRRHALRPAPRCWRNGRCRAAPTSARCACGSPASRISRPRPSRPRSGPTARRIRTPCSISITPC